MTHNEITKQYYMSRRLFPPPHIKLNKAQAVTLRQLQTRSYFSPVQYKEWYNIQDMNTICKAFREGECTLEHMLSERGSLGPGITRLALLVTCSQA